MKQWHPLFAKLLRPLVESHFDVQTDLPVGDVPRQAASCSCGGRGRGRCPSAGCGGI